MELKPCSRVAGTGGVVRMLFLLCRLLLRGRVGVGLLLKEAKAVGHTAGLQEGRVSGCRTIKALAIMGPFLF